MHTNTHTHTWPNPDGRLPKLPSPELDGPDIDGAWSDAPLLSLPKSASDPPDRTPMCACLCMYVCVCVCVCAFVFASAFASVFHPYT